MAIIGHVESLWRYPVKSMRGEEVQQAFVGFAGVYGDRLYAIHDGGALKGFPYLTGREQERMLLYKPRFRDGKQTLLPPNLSVAEILGPGLTPMYGSQHDMALEIETPAKRAFPIDDPGLLSELSEGLDDNHALTLVRSDRALTDCRPISIFSLQTMQQIGREAGLTLDKRRFRANIYSDLNLAPFAENGLVGRRLHVGTKAILAVIAPDPRCKMITLDPETGEAKPEVLRVVAQRHSGNAGLYGAVLTEGLVRTGDEIDLLD
jgi:uncharacterized protein YcbX